MIEYKTGDIIGEDAEALVNSVNCVGIMGRGIALQFKNAFPENFKAYESACRRNELQPGGLLVFRTQGLSNPQYIINFPTKRHWRGRSRISDIEAGLKALVREIRRLGVRSIAIPPLGSGLGGLEWSDVRPRIEAAARDLDDKVRVTIFEPRESDRVPIRSAKVPSMTPGRAALIGLIQRYLSALMDPFVTLLEIHKLMYFMQEAGERLRLNYVKAPYGPYAENLRHVLTAIEGYYLSGYADGGDEPTKQLELVPGATSDAEAFLRDKTKTQAHFNRVAGLVEGFETPLGLELLATVHWVAAKEQARSEGDIIALTYAWNERKRRFSEQQIRLALEVLKSKNWISDRSPRD
ncbi:type II toxin-antitoxin system antitoxin DNA ADP-ribosyl glycohydrolase DarG [Candidatus Binatus sp.]|jgi:O-acetyl-ADP-ribose deacetylase (regulator of RNase III)|uniref:type II toxin-antitoxin system antitoxin DNA ADP-ribosyl glycohydrolase DarG n=1 Tax=Candidatus Binatus sp. TaxID=2811406 RepID=UPI003BDA1635